MPAELEARVTNIAIIEFDGIVSNENTTMSIGQRVEDRDPG